MGIFGNKSLTLGFNSLEFEQSNTKANNLGKFKLGKNNSLKYGIDRTIDLVTKLRKHNVSSKVIAGIMKQTLESVEIHFTDIVTDAKRKEADIHAESERKDEEIQALKEKLEELKKQKTELQKEQDETKSVREFLQQAMSEDLYINVQEGKTQSATAEHANNETAQASRI